MVWWFKIGGLVLLAGGAIMAGPAPKAAAATSATLDILPDEGSGAPGSTVELGSLKPIARPGRDVAVLPPSGNPLWAVPLSVLTATQERPIFSASRRPLPRAVAATPAEQPIAPAVRAEPERLLLTLIGAVVGDGDAIALFLDRTNQKVVRLRQGETHAGWVLSQVQQREVTLTKLDRTEVLVLPRPGSPVETGTVGAPAPIIPTAGTDTSYVPFTPRSTPKNGESDGL
jgi:general secretion pathway protein N